MRNPIQKNNLLLATNRPAKAIMTLSTLLLLGGILSACGSSTNSSTGSTTSSASPAVNYPTRPVQIDFPFTVGTPGDLLARELAPALQATLKQPFNVIDVPGAAGATGMSQALSASPNGYTLALAPLATLAVQPHRTRLSYGSPSTYTPIASLTNEPEVLLVSSKSPFKTLNEFIAYAKLHQVSVGDSGLGTILDIDSKLLAHDAGYSVNDVPFTGEPQAVAAVLGSHVTAAVVGVTTALPYVKAGNIRVLATFTPKALPSLPNVPPISSFGYKIYYGVSDYLIAPHGLASSIANKLATAVSQALKSPKLDAFVAKEGWQLTPGGPSSTLAVLEKDYQEMGAIVNELHLQVKG